MATATQLEKSGPGTPDKTPVNGVSTLWVRSRVWWASLPSAQRSGMVVALALLGVILGGLLYLMLRTDWRTLYANLDADEARQIGTVLTQAQIPFDVTPDGGGIRVAAAQLDKARLATAAKGAIRSGRLGFELFDKPNWVGSEFDEQVNYQRALEGELEHTVSSLSDVASARVHLVLRHDSLFRDQDRPAKASVVLKLRHRSLADGEAEAIRNLVASAVDGLTSDRVVLVDAAGQVQMGARSADALRSSAEQALEEKLVSTLEPVTGAGNVRASITLDYESAAAEETEETYDPDQTVTLSMQRTEQTSGPQAVASRVPGTASNAHNAQSLPVTERSPPKRQKRIQYLWRIEDCAPQGGESGAGAENDSRHRGKRPSGRGCAERKSGRVAEPVAGRAAQPDGVGAGGSGFRRRARRSADGRRSFLRRQSPRA